MKFKKEKILKDIDENVIEDSLEDEIEAQALAEYEKAQEEYRNHWLWKKLNVTPEEYYEKVQAHIDSLNISNEEWNQTYLQTKQEIKTRAREQDQAYQPINPDFMNHIRI